MKPLRIVTLADLHIGHLAALTEPIYWLPEDTPLGRLQRELWALWEGLVQQLRRPDWLFCLGDAIEGKGAKSGGTELILPDRHEQARSAARILAMMKPARVVMVHGTPYHTGDSEDFETVTCDNLNALGIPSEIHSQPFVQVASVVFHLKHKVGGSSIPHGVHTAPAREAVYHELQAAERDWPRARVILRGHTHEYSYCGTAHRLAMILPALKAAHDKYGSRQVAKPVDWGLVSWEIRGEEFTWKPHTHAVREAEPCLIR